MPRLILSDELWSKLKKILLHQAIDHKPNLRMTIAQLPSAEVIVADKGYTVSGSANRSKRREPDR